MPALDDAQPVEGALITPWVRRFGVSLAGYTLDQLMIHLERQFKRGMTWSNYGKAGWHVDHIQPKICFKYASAADVEFKQCWELSNLRPMWGQDNIRKGSKKLYLL